MPEQNINLKSKSEILKDVKAFYDDDVLMVLPEYEMKRGNDQFSITLCISVIVSFCLAAVYPFFIIVAIILTLLLGCTTQSSKQFVNYDLMLKEELMPKFLQIFGDFKWQSHFLTEIAIIQKLKLLKIFPESFMTMLDDTIIGNYKDVGINIFEIRTGIFAYSWLVFIFLLGFTPFILIPIVIVGFIICSLSELLHFSDGFIIFLLTLDIIFIPLIFLKLIYTVSLKHSLKGVVVEYTFPKNFKQETFVYENNALTQNFLTKYQNKYRRVLLEDADFNKSFLVYSNDQVEARYLLTASFIERFKKIKVAFKPESLRAEFKDNKLYLLIKTGRDLFRFGSLNKETTFHNFKVSADELYSIIALVDHFKLDQKIGL